MIQPTALLCFSCPDCERTSYNASDIKEGFCGHCKTYYRSAPERFPPMWIVCEHPRDYPEHYTVRVSWGPWRETRVALCGTLELARQHCLREGASLIVDRRRPGQDPVIIEVWI